MHMQSYYIQYPSMYPNHASPQKLIVASNNLVKEDVDYSKADEKSAKQDSKLVSYSEAKAAMFAQGVNKVTSGAYARKVN